MCEQDSTGLCTVCDHHDHDHEGADPVSSEAIGYVWRFSPYRPRAPFWIHLAIADVVNDQHDNEFFMAQGKLAAKTGYGRGTVNEALATLEADGYIERVGELGRNVVRWQFIFKPGDVQFDSRTRRTRAVESADSSTAKRAARPVGSADSNVRAHPTATRLDLSAEPTQNPREPEPKGEPSPQAARARALVQAHWDRCKAERRPTPIVKRGKSGSPFMAMVKIVEQVLDAGWGEPAVAAALWDADGGHTLQGLGVQLTKARARAERAAAADGWLPLTGPDGGTVGRQRVEPGSRPLWADRPDCPTCDGVGMIFDEATKLASYCPTCNSAAVSG